MAWAFVVGLLALVFLIGLGLLGGDLSGISLWLLHLAPILVLVFAALARAGRRHWLWALALAVVVFLVPIFAILRDSTPILAALHPVAAVLAFPVALVVAVNSARAMRAPMPALARVPA